jgi:thiamine-monophosphate kinase
LGKAGAGLYNLKNKILDNELSKALIEPTPKLKEGNLLARQKCVSSCMDISDGLSSSLYQLQELNDVGFEIDLSSIPISSELIQLHKEKNDLDIYNIALHFGGDYELLVTIPAQKFEKIKEILKKKGAGLFAIGSVTRNKEIIINNGKVKKILENKGYEHFTN